MQKYGAADYVSWQGRPAQNYWLFACLLACLVRAVNDVKYFRKSLEKAADKKMALLHCSGVFADS